MINQVLFVGSGYALITVFSLLPALLRRSSGPTASMFMKYEFRSLTVVAEAVAQKQYRQTGRAVQTVV